MKMRTKVFKNSLTILLLLLSVIIPFNVDTVFASATRQNYYAESTALSTHTGDTNYTDKTTLSFTPDADSTYVIIASWLMNESSASYGVYAKLTRTTGTPTDLNELLYVPKDATDYYMGGAIAIESFGASPSSQTYKIQYATSNSAATARIKEAKIIAIKLNSDDKYIEDTTRTTSSSTSYVDKLSLSFTPPSTGDYIVLASTTMDAPNVNNDYKVQITVDGTAYSSSNVEVVNYNNKYPWATMKRVNLSATSHTLKLQYCSESASYAVGSAHARLVALRADGFSNNYFTETETRSTTTSTSYQTFTTLTQTPNAGDHLIIGAAGIDGSSSSYESYVQLLNGSTS